MIGMTVTFGWVVVGLIVAAVDKSLRDDPQADGAMVTILAVVGAIVGASIGQSFRLFVFGEPLGFLVSGAGAEAFLFVCRARSLSLRTARPAGAGAAAPAPAGPAPRP